MDSCQILLARLRTPRRVVSAASAATPVLARVAALACILIAFATFARADDSAARFEFFEKNIRPQMIEHCYGCHSTAKDPKGGLRLDSRDGVRQGGDSGAAITPGDAPASLLLKALRYDGLEMPPTGKLPETIVADFERWIAMGAPDPRTASAGNQPATGELHQSASDGRGHWAFQPLAVVPPPQVKLAAWPRTAIDRFVLAQLEQHALQPVEDARPQTLVRRLFFDLTGLPPGVAELDYWSARFASPTLSTELASLAGESGSVDQAAVAELVDQLLASPAFGERWARHWLDLARFSESNGGDRNVVWPHAWRYRNWVIDALNADYPYDQFLRDQLAGDLLPAQTTAQRDRQLVATGLLTLGSKLFMETVADRFRMDVVDEQIDVVSRAMLGLTVSCARCHDHKFDPIPTRDYYALAGIFRSTDLLYGTAAPAGNQYGHDRPLQPIGPNALALHGPAEAWQKAVGEQVAVRNKARSDRYRVVRQKAADENRLHLLRQAKADQEPADPAVQMLLTEIEKQAVEIADWDAKIQRLDEELKRLEQNPPPFPHYAMAVRNADQPADCHVCIRGQYNQPGPSVPRGGLTLLDGLPTPMIPDNTSGRLELAQWITDMRNPLTPRVAANRVWQRLFGEGLVRTVDNFGKLGERPSHPELLDYLADGLLRDGWSIKRLIRRIVLSRTYRLASAGPCSVDPDNRLLSHMRVRRLEAEPLRDAMLAISGELERSRPAGSVVSAIEEAEFNDRVRLPTEQLDARCRAIYLPLVRNNLPPMFSKFDFADPSLVIGQREDRTMVDQQLFLMNSPFAIARAEAAARRLLAETQLGNDERVDLAFRRFFGRRPHQAQREQVLAYIQSVQESENGPAATQVAWSRLCQALFAAAEMRLVQ